MRERVHRNPLVITERDATASHMATQPGDTVGRLRTVIYATIELVKVHRSMSRSMVTEVEEQES